MSPILLDPEEQRQIEELLESTDPLVQRRARIVLIYHYGAPTRQVASEVGLSRSQTRYYRHLFEVERMGMFPTPSYLPHLAAPNGGEQSLPPMSEAGGGQSRPSLSDAAVDQSLPHISESEELQGLPQISEFGGGGRGSDAETVEERTARRAAKKVARRAKKQARRAAETPSQPPPFSKDENGGGQSLPPLPLGEELEVLPSPEIAETGVPLRRGAATLRPQDEPAAPPDLPAVEIQEETPSNLPHLAAQNGGGQSLPPLPMGEGQEPPSSLPLPAPLAAPGILPNDPLAEAGRKILLFHFAEMLRHEEGTRLGEEIEALHDMRVATRRMRAALDVFGPAYKPKTVQKHLKGLRAAGRALGRVRDLDVFIEKADSYLASLKPANRPGLDPLLANWRAERELDRVEMITLLGSKAHARFIQDFNRFVQTPGLGAAPQFQVATASVLPSATQVRHVAPTLIYTRLAAVRAFETILPTASVPQLHLLRIEFKKLRYTMEFFQEVLGPEARQVINAIKKVQDHLGNLQDAEVACQRLRQFLDEEDLRQTELPLADRQSPAAVVTYLAERHTERHRLITTFPQIWQTFNSPEFQHSLAMSISIL